MAFVTLLQRIISFHQAGKTKMGPHLTPGAVAVLIVLGSWFLLSVLHQFTNRYGAWARKINQYALIPAWTFFAPTPGTCNYRFVFRETFSDGTEGEWEEIPWCEERALLHAIWHPRRHREKLIVDCVHGLGQVIRNLEQQGVDPHTTPQSWMVSTPYVMLLNIAMSPPRSSQYATGRRFAVLEQCPGIPDIPFKLIVCSSRHEY